MLNHKVSDYKILISSLFIVISFFLGYNLAEKKLALNLDKQKNKIHIINLEISKTKIDINKDKNILLKINGQKTSSGTIFLK